VDGESRRFDRQVSLWPANVGTAYPEECARFCLSFAGVKCPQLTERLGEDVPWQKLFGELRKT
jgi:hypothetical protein